MKKYTVTAVALLSTLVGGSALQAEGTQAGSSAQKPQVVAPATAKAVDPVVSKLSAEEQAFAAKLNDQNRKAFVEKLSAEQRKVAMTAAKVSTAANAADEAVAKLAGALGVEKDRNIADVK